MAHMNASIWGCLLVLLLLGGRFAAAEEEIGFPPEERQKMDDWERRNLGEAEDVFYARGKHDKVAKSKKHWSMAATKFNLFIDEFPRSPAVPYALYMKGRALHLDDKRNQARQEYDDLHQFFPNNIRFATAALYYKGLSHKQDGDVEQAFQTWAIIAKDPDYSRQPIAASAIVELAQHSWNKDRFQDAAKFFRQVALSFYKSNRRAAEAAADRYVEYCIRVSPSEERLREFYHENQGFRHRRSGKNLPGVEQLIEDKQYWDDVRSRIRRYGRFDDLQKSQRQSYYSYWAGQLANRFSDWDEYQYDYADFRLAAGGSREEWFQHLDRLFRDGAQDDNSRVIKWIGWYAFDADKVKEYYGKLSFDRMSFRQTFNVLKILYEKVGVAEAGQLVAGKFKLGKMKDSEKAELALYLFKRDRDFATTIANQISDKHEKNWALLQMFAQAEDMPLNDRLEPADALAGSEKYASAASWKKGDMLESAGEYERAIPAYLGAPDQGAKMAFAVARCHMSNGSVDRSLQELQGGEAAFKEEAPNFAWKMQEYQEKAGRKKAMIATLRRISKQYKGSTAWKRAHTKLEDELGLSVEGAETIDE